MFSISLYPSLCVWQITQQDKAAIEESPNTDGPSREDGKGKSIQDNSYINEKKKKFMEKSNFNSLSNNKNTTILVSIKMSWSF